MDTTTFSKNLKARMADLGISQAELVSMCQPYCSELGVKLTKKNLSQYVNGQFVPRHGKLTVLCRALDVDEGYFLYGDEDLVLSSDETALVRCWRKANLDEREAVAFALRKRGIIPVYPASEKEA